MSWKVAVLPGDGIGPEVTKEALKVLKATGRRFSLSFDFIEGLAGGAAYEKTGHPLPAETLELCQKSDAVLFGAVGGPRWDTLPPDLRPEAGCLLRLRKELGLYANLRPVKVYPGTESSSPVKEETVKGVDLLIVRELTGGLYFGRKYREPADGGVRAVDTLEYTTGEVDRIVRLAFELAQRRRGRVTSVDKANVLESSRFWREVAEAAARDYPGVELVHMYVDNCAMQLVKNPRQFDVLVTENMFGDILSDLASVLAGSLGMLASASLGEGTALYEPGHGSAPDIAGRGTANPTAAIISAALMLRYSFGLAEAADCVERAVASVLAEGYRTADIAAGESRVVGTERMGDLVAEKIESGV